MEAPFDDGEVWVLGNRCQRYNRYTKIFEIHDNLEQHDPGYAQWLVDKNIPLVVGENFPIQADHVEVFPYKKVAELIGSTYLTSSSAAMLAYALLNGHKKIDIYGVDMAVDDHEYFFQRPCMEFWVGFAAGRGAKIYIPDSSPLCNSEYVEGRDYGNSRPEPPTTKNECSKIAEQHGNKVIEATNRLEELSQVEAEIEQLKISITAHDAAQQVYTRLAKVQRAQDSKQSIKSLLDTVVIND